MAKLPTRKKIFNLAGESFDNSDGSSRQDELLECEPGEPVELVREPTNPHGASAVLVRSFRGVGIGYLASADSAVIAPALDEGRPHVAKLHCLRGGVPGARSYGAQISIAWDGNPPHPHEPLDEVQQKSRRGKRSVQGRKRDASGKLIGGSKSGCAGSLMFLGVTMLSAFNYITS